MDLSSRQGIIDYCKKFINPVIVTDRDFKVVYCNRSSFVKVSSCLSEFPHTDFHVDPEKQTLAMLMIKDVQHCARIMLLNDELVMFELFNIESIRQLSGYTDILDKVMPLVEGINSYTMQGINLVFSMYQDPIVKEYPEMHDALSGIYRCGNNLRSISDNLRIYTKMLYEQRSLEVIDVFVLLDNMVKRCNKVLSGCGRRIDFLGESNGMYVLADQRHVICTMINALQNAVLYSPVETVPTVTLFRTELEMRPVICVRVINEDVYFSDGNFEDELNFSSQRIGLGIPIIKRFAEIYGGKFLIEKNDQKVVLQIMIPACNSGNPSGTSEDEKIYSVLHSGAPDTVDEKLQEIMDFYGMNDII